MRNDRFLFLVWFTRWLIGFNPFNTYINSIFIYSAFSRPPLSCSHSSPMLRFLKLNFYRSSSKPESCISVDFERWFCFRTSDTALTTKKFRSWTSEGRFLALWKYTRPAQPPQEVHQAEFMNLACACITYQEFMLCKGPYRGHKVRVLFLFLNLVFYLYPLLRV